MWEVAYKLKWLSVVTWSDWYPAINVKLVERFIDWKHDKFINTFDGIDVLGNAVIYEKDFNSIKSKAEQKREKKRLYKEKFNKLIRTQ